MPTLFDALRKQLAGGSLPPWKGHKADQSFNSRMAGTSGSMTE